MVNNKAIRQINIWFAYCFTRYMFIFCRWWLENYPL